MIEYQTKEGDTMRIINISKTEFEKLRLLCTSLESDLYIYDKDIVLKKLDENLKDRFDNKIYTISELSKNKDIINIPELVIPESLLKVENEIMGFTMKYIQGPTLENILKSEEYTIKQKIEYLKQIGIILEKMKSVRNSTPIKNFYLNDMHEGNFILNKKTNKIHVIDLDSSKIGNNETGCAKYLTPLNKITTVPKYKKLEYPIFGGYFEIDENTDLYCYIIMVLNYIYGSNISKLYIKEYYDYLEYLLKLGISKELIDKLSYIYTNQDNENIYEYLDELIPYYEKTNRKVYENKM